MADLETFRAYARLDYDDPSAKLVLDAAVETARMAGVPPMQGNAKYDLLIYALALHHYDNRGFSPGYAVDVRTQDDWVGRQITAALVSLRLEAELHPPGGDGDGGT